MRLAIGGVVLAADLFRAHTAHAFVVGEISPVAEAGGAKTYPIPAADGVSIDQANDTIVARWQGKVYVFALACPHQNTAIRWQADRKRFECPKHKSHYTPDGRFTDGRATRGLDRHPVTRAGETVVADLAVLYEEDEQKDAWTRAFVAL
jgi:Rieske Fe-S protein